MGAEESATTLASEAQQNNLRADGQVPRSADKTGQLAEPDQCIQGRRRLVSWSRSLACRRAPHSEAVWFICGGKCNSCAGEHRVLTWPLYALRASPNTSCCPSPLRSVRCGRQAHAAVERISEASQAGYRWGVDCDLKGYFDTVNYDLLIAQLRQHINDKRVLRLIGKYLRAGVRLADGTTEKTLKGVPQGGPLSPLMANVMLDPLDKKIEAMGLPFVRYADDCSGLLRIRSCRFARNLVVTRSKNRALEVMAEVREYVEGSLKLLVNQDKSKVAPLGECAFLGFTVKVGRIRLSDKATKRFKSRIQKITGRSRGISMKQRLLELKRYCVGAGVRDGSRYPILNQCS